MAAMPPIFCASAMAWMARVVLPLDSYCTIEGYSSAPTLKEGETAKYVCYFKDGKGNAMDIATFLSLNDYDFTCETKRTSPSSKTYSNKVNNKGTYYECPFEITESGAYQFYGYLVPKGKTTKTTIKAKINKFYVSSGKLSLNLAKVLNNYNKRWVSIENNPVIEYKNDKNGRLTSLDLVDSTGTLMSKYKAYPEDFDASKIKVEFYSEHDKDVSFGDFYCKVYKDGSTEYIGVFNSKNLESDKVIKRSSFDYTLKFTFGDVVKYVTLRYNPDTLKIGSYTTCFHDLDLSKTYTDIPWSGVELPVGRETKLGTVELRT